MATTYYDAEDFITVHAGLFPLTILAQTGDGQGGGYLIFNGSHLIGANDKAVIGSIKDIKEWLTITATIKDKLEETNWTSVSVTLQANGQQTYTFGPYKQEVEKHLDTVGYTIRIKILQS